MSRAALRRLSVLPTALLCCAAVAADPHETSLSLEGSLEGATSIQITNLIGSVEVRGGGKAGAYVLGGRVIAEAGSDEEARALADSIPPRYRVVALDPGGRSGDSAEFAADLTRLAMPGVCFIIGGPTGLDAAFRDRADSRWSLSALTFPHEIARVLLWEQVYRALTIQRGIPYHK